MADHLRNAILTLELPPGSALDEGGLGTRFGLSRTPVREVFRELDGLGYLTLRENRGARVSELSAATLRDFFISAPLIYGAILKLAARNATATGLADLEAAQTAFRAALRTGSAAERTLANIRFHEITGALAGNTYLLPSFRRLLIDHARIGMTFYRPRDAAMARNLATASEQHEAIIEAIRSGDEVRAGSLADAHWALSRDQISLYVLPDALDGALGSVASGGRP